ncbi:MAG: DUF2752 domain-containing protein [Flammeovirgaceae bacterium]|jgi:hypothetical protein|nr:DUF2752 domain-containing protein [Flammeovirgaceae bacterium]
MFGNKQSLYLLLSLACLAGYAWLIIHLYQEQTQQQARAFGTCLMKQTTGIPCPSCGSTRAIVALTQGNVSEAMLLNPLGFIIALVLIILPIWLGYDKLRNSESLYQFYRHTEKTLRQPKWAIPLSLLVILNWIWNIYKDV